MVDSQDNTRSIANPQTAIIQSQNAQRVSRRRAAATFAQSVAQTGRNDLRRGPKRVVGGRFEKLQKVPKAKKQKQQGISQTDIERFLSSFRFDPSRTVLAESRSGQVLPRNLLAPGEENKIIARSRQRTSRIIQPGAGSGLFGGTLFSQL